MLDTIQILRGIAEKYASFHGVRISDRALVAAAELSTRYIQGRFRESPAPLPLSPCWPPFPALVTTSLSRQRGRCEVFKCCLVGEGLWVV